jgi:hypothetical protein
MYYNGDLHDNRFLLPNSELIRAYYGTDFTVLLVDRLDMSLGYIHGSIEGDDATSASKYNKNRNLSFYSTIDEINLNFRLRVFSARDKELVNPYLVAGIGYFWFNPKADYNGKSYELQPLGTEGQYISGGNHPEPYKLSSASLGLGIGIHFRIDDHFGVRLEAMPRLTFTDYLDDTSSDYPDSSTLAATPNGAIAVLLSSRYDKGYPREGLRRGNADKNDVIITMGVGLVYTPGYKRKIIGQRMGVIHKIFKKSRGWRR